MTQGEQTTTSVGTYMNWIINRESIAIQLRIYKGPTPRIVWGKPNSELLIGRYALKLSK